MSAPYSAKAVANFFLEKEELTQMQLHKLVYFAHGWHLGYRGGPLLDETLEAWQYGPVVPTLYREFFEFGAEPITRPARVIDWATLEEVEPAIEPSDTHVRELLEKVWSVYGGFSAAQLSRLTHQEGTPWSVTRRDNPGLKHAGIPNKVVQEYYRERIRRYRDRSG